MANVYTGTMNGAVQTAYYVAPPQGLPGQQTFIDEVHVLNSYPVQSDFIYCGRGVCKGTDITVPQNVYGNNNSPFGVIAPTGTSTVADFVGLLVLDHAARNDADGNAGKQKYDMAGILEDGFCFVKLYQATAAKGAAFMVINATNPLNAPIGTFLSDNAGGAAIEIPRLQWWATYNHLAQPYGVIRVFAK